MPAAAAPRGAGDQVERAGFGPNDVEAQHRLVGGANLLDLELVIGHALAVVNAQREQGSNQAALAQTRRRTLAWQERVNPTEQSFGLTRRLVERGLAREQAVVLGVEQDDQAQDEDCAAASSLIDRSRARPATQQLAQRQQGQLVEAPRGAESPHSISSRNAASLRKRSL